MYSAYSFNDQITSLPRAWVSSLDKLRISGRNFFNLHPTSKVFHALLNRAAQSISYGDMRVAYARQLGFVSASAEMRMHGLARQQCTMNERRKKKRKFHPEAWVDDTSLCAS